MGFTHIHTDLMFSALDHFLGTDTPVRIFRDDLGVSFETELGNHGLVIPNEGGNWDILVNDSKIYEIENEVYSIITHEGNAPAINEYMRQLKDLISSPIKERSKEFVKMTRDGIKVLAAIGKIDLGESFSHGPFFVFIDKQGNKNRIIMN
jgi:hypothetical protein